MPFRSKAVGGSGEALSRGPSPQTRLCRGAQQSGHCPPGPRSVGGSGDPVSRGPPPQTRLRRAHWNRALAWLLAGDFEQGWPEYEWRWQWKDFPSSKRSFSQPLWDGSSLAGRTILLHAEQGLGDTIQFIRYAPLVKSSGGTVILECQPALLRLLQSCAGVDRLLAKGSSLPHFDVHAPLLSLPGILETTLSTIPAEVPYLFADANLVEHWRQELSHMRGFKIGIAWQGNLQYKADRQRSAGVLSLRHWRGWRGSI